MKVYQLQTNAEKIDNFFNNNGNCLLDIVNILPESFDIQVKGEEELIHYNVRPFNQKICVGNVHFDNDDIITIRSANDWTYLSPDLTTKTILFSFERNINQTVRTPSIVFDSNATVKIEPAINSSISITYDSDNIYIGSSLTPFLEVVDQGNGIYEFTIL